MLVREQKDCCLNNFKFCHVFIWHDRQLCLMTASWSKQCAWVLPPSRLITLPASTIHIWRVYLSDPLAETLRLTDLPSAERSSSKSLSSKTSRAYLRNVLSRYTGVPPARLDVHHHRHGKPYLPTGPHFNVAHTGPVALIAVADRPLGVDVESAHRRLSNLPRLLSRLPECEAAALRAAPCPRAAFLALWTRKEAFVKCTGDGIRRGLSSFDVSLLPQSAWVQSVDGSTQAAAAYWGSDIHVHDHVAALVYKGSPPARIVQFDWAPELLLE